MLEILWSVTPVMPESSNTERAYRLKQSYMDLQNKQNGIRDIKVQNYGSTFRALS